MESSHDSKLKDPHYGNVKEGKKIYEVRVYDETRQKMKVSDIWIFSHNDNNFSTVSVLSELNLLKQVQSFILVQVLFFQC